MRIASTHSIASHPGCASGHLVFNGRVITTAIKYVADGGIPMWKKYTSNADKEQVLCNDMCTSVRHD